MTGAPLASIRGYPRASVRPHQSTCSRAPKRPHDMCWRILSRVGVENWLDDPGTNRPRIAPHPRSSRFREVAHWRWNLPANYAAALKSITQYLILDDCLFAVIKAASLRARSSWRRNLRTSRLSDSFSLASSSHLLRAFPPTPRPARASSTILRKFCFL